MSQTENCYPRHRRWSAMSRVKKIVVMIIAAIIFIPLFLALFGEVTMRLWNWLMPAIFKLPTIGFWQALGLIILSHILFRGGHARRAGRSQWKRARIREEMSAGAPEAKAE